MWVDPDGNEPTSGVPDNTECYDRNTLVTFQDSTGKVHDQTASWTSVPQPAWKYYIPIDDNADGNAGIWNGPEADPQVCYFKSGGGGQACDSDPKSEYGEHVSVATNRQMGSAPILTDIANCHLPAISWVIPDERWSDHPGSFDYGLGPDWVASIVDAIGKSWQNSLGGGHCDYWGYGNNSPNPEPTAIFITWDDWGGFYDHVPPPKVYQGSASDTCTTQQAPNGWGCGYVYGFRVPLLVVSNWTPAGYVSGPVSGTPSYPPPKEWTHDFGSILAFIENNFTQQGLNLPPIAPQIPIKYTYADQNSLDSVGGNIPLWDFFRGPQRGFTYINPINSTDTASFFMNYYYQNNAQPIGPEDGDPLD